MPGFRQLLAVRAEQQFMMPVDRLRQTQQLLQQNVQIGVNTIILYTGKL